MNADLADDWVVASTSFRASLGGDNGSFMAEKNKAAKKKISESKAVVIARKTRERCNNLDDAQRAELTLHAMRLIYGNDAVPANRS